MLHRFADIHTHVGPCPEAILSLPVGRVEAVVAANAALPEAARQCYSLQLHPWHLCSEADVFAFCATAHRLADDPAFVAIGECGLDGLCDTPPALQQKAFLTALHTARQMELPVIVHCVRLWGDMMRCVHQVFPELRSDPEAWRRHLVIVHGFRRGLPLAQQLLEAGFCLSLGPKHDPRVAQTLPSERLYAETDAV